MHKNRIIEVLNRLYRALNIKNDAEFCSKFDVAPNTVSGWKRRDSIPYTLIEEIAQKEHLSLDQILFGKELLKNAQNVQQSHNNPDTYSVSKISAKASAGGGNHLESLDVYDSGETMYIDRGLFEHPPRGRLGIMQVDGYSMTPMLWHDNWVIFEEIERFTKDGLYILNFDNTLMVKLLQADLITGKIDIISSNKDYKSYTFDPKSDQTAFYIIGKVVRVIM